MLRRLPIILSLVLAAVLAIAPAAMAANQVRGEMDLQFNLAWPGQQKTIPDWVGTLTIDGTAYDMAFFAYGNGKPFEARPGTAEANSKAFFFEEIWTVYAPGTMTAVWSAGGVTSFAPGDVVLSGYDRGLTNNANSKYHMVGHVDVANAPFDGLEGRNIKMNGVIEWYPSGAPHYAPGSFRIN